METVKFEMMDGSFYGYKIDTPHLDFRSDPVTKLPEDIGKLKALKTLILNGSWLLNVIPESIGDLFSLHTLDLTGTEITILPESICNLKNLKTLKLGASLITKLPENIGELTNLEELDLQLTQIAELPKSISNLTNLQTLNLSGTKIKEFPESISNLTALKSLSLENTGIHQLPANLANLPHLKSLSIAGTFIEGVKLHTATTLDARAILCEIAAYEDHYAQYEQAMSSAALADLTQGIAHEFGQPVTNIRFNIQYHQMLFDKQNSDSVDKATVLQCFADILRQTERIGDLVNSLEPITSRKAAPSVFSLPEALQRALEQERIRIDSLGVALHVKVAEDAQTIEFDPVQFNQILTNLLINSLDSLEEKKRRSADFRPEIRIFAQSDNKGHRLSVSDNGTGIREEDRERMFNPFFTTKPPGKGQGLGLYIISRLLKMHSGSIQLDPHYTQGAKFDLFIPKPKHA